jgi:class 3 adenylate cyclase/CheY-like chemotaxis protein
MTRPGRVLVVDDNEINRDVLARRLAELGHVVGLAVNGEQALEKLRAEPFDVMLLDLLMPRLSGEQVLERLQQDPALRHLPVVVISAVHEVDRISRCLERGAADYLTKPFEPLILKARIDACLERKRWHDQEQDARRQLELAGQRLEERVRTATEEVQTINELLHRRFREIAGMVEVAKAIISVLDLDTLLTGIMELSKDVVAAEASSLLVMEPDRRRLRFHVATGRAGLAMEGGTIEVGQGIAGHVAETGEPLLIEDAYADPRFDPSFDKKTGFQTRSLLTVPLKTRDGVIGLVQVINKRDQARFDRHDLDLFQSFASMASISLHNAGLFEQIKRMAEDLRTALEKERWLAIEKEKLGAYIPRHVVDEITRNREQKLALGGKTIRATILFSDIEGFTRLSERLEPQRVVSFLNEYMTAMVKVIEEEGGILDKFIGDGIMAIFLAQTAGADHPFRAVRAGVRMQRRIAGLTREWAVTRPEVAGLRVRVGINTGEVVAGNIGAETRMDYTVIGDNVNLAARLESHGQAGEVHVSEAVYREVKDVVVARKLGPITVKNRVQPVEVYAVDLGSPDG